MQFLLAAIRKNQRRIRIEQWLLLAIRTLLILLVVLAMAKPFLEAFGNVIAGGRTHRVLVLDNSLSMGYATAGTSRFDQAKTVATQIVKDSRPGDAVSLIMMGSPPRVVIGDPSAQPERGPEGDPGTHALARGDRSRWPRSRPSTGCSTSRPFPRRRSSSSRICRARAGGGGILGARTAWTSASWPSWQLAGPDRWSSTSGNAGSPNRAVTDLRVEAPVVTTGSTVMVRGVVRNFGPSRADGVSVRLNVDGRQGPEQALDLPVGEDVPVIFNHQFATSRRSCRRDERWRTISFPWTTAACWSSPSGSR